MAISRYKAADHGLAAGDCHVGLRPPRNDIFGRFSETASPFLSSRGRQAVAISRYKAADHRLVAGDCHVGLRPPRNDIFGRFSGIVPLVCHREADRPWRSPGTRRQIIGFRRRLPRRAFALLAMTYLAGRMGKNKNSQNRCRQAAKSVLYYVYVVLCPFHFLSRRVIL